MTVHGDGAGHDAAGRHRRHGVARPGAGTRRTRAAWARASAERLGDAAERHVAHVHLRRRAHGGRPATGARDRPAAARRTVAELQRLLRAEPARTALAPVDGTPWLSERHAADFVRIDRPGPRRRRRPDEELELLRLRPAGDLGRLGSRRAHENDLPSIPPLNELPAEQLQRRGRRSATTWWSGWPTAATRSTPTCAGQRARASRTDRAHGADLGRVGNSGNTGGPHLHFQLADRPRRRRLRRAAVRVSAVHAGRLGDERRGVPDGDGAADIRRRARAAGAARSAPLQATVVRFPG